MGVGVGLVLIAAGAILTWAVNASLSGLNIHAVGVILLILGIVLVMLDLLWWQSWSMGRPMGPMRRRAVYVDDGVTPVAPVAPAPPAGRRVVVDEEEVGPGPPGGPPPPP
jgi:hypothetical protein